VDCSERWVRIDSNLQIRVDNFAHFSHGGFQVALAEQAGAGHKCVRTGAGAFGGGLEIDAAVHADLIANFFSRRHASACWIFGSVSWMNSWPPKPGLTVITSSRSILSRTARRFGDGGRRIDGEADFFAERFYFPDERLDLFAQFDVNDDFVGPGFRRTVRAGFPAWST
jgi:hypothetical protein